MAKKLSVVTEFGIFNIVLPLLVILMMGAISSYEKRPTPEMVERLHLIWIWMGAACAMCAAGGVLVLLQRKVWTIYAAIFGAATIPLVYCAAMVVATGTLSINLITIVAILIPVVPCARLSKAVAELRPVVVPPIPSNTGIPMPPPPPPPPIRTK